MKDSVSVSGHSELNYSALVDAVFTRKSTRGFERPVITEQDREKLQHFINSIDVPFEQNVDITLNNSYANSGKTSVFIINVSSDFAAISAPDSLTDKSKAGFLGELFILFCESIGISTCWVGSFKKEEAYRQIFGKGEELAGKKIFCLIAMGYNLSGKGFLNKLTYKIYSSKRKRLEELLSIDSIGEFPDSIKDALELARIAPSARNKQCWYFKVGLAGDEKKDGNSRADRKKGSFIVEIGKPEGYKITGWPHPDLDVGIAASHFWLGLKNQNIECSIKIKEIKNRIIWQFGI